MGRERAPGRGAIPPGAGLGDSVTRRALSDARRQRLDHSQPLADGLGRRHDRGAHHQQPLCGPQLIVGTRPLGRPAPSARVEHGGRAGERGRSRGGAPLRARPARVRPFSAVPLAVTMPRVPLGLPSELLERRPDVAAAERRAAAANARIGVAKAAYFPSLTLSGNTGFRSAAATDLFAASSRFWSIGPALAQSIFDAGLRRAQTEQAIAAYHATVAEYRQAVLAPLQELQHHLAPLPILPVSA